MVRIDICREQNVAQRGRAAKSRVLRTDCLTKTVQENGKLLTSTARRERESEQSEWNRWTENNKTTTTTKTTSTHQFLFNSSCKLLNRSSKLAHTHKETPPKKIQNNNNNNKKWNKQTKNKRRKKQKSPSTVSIFNCYSTYVCMCLLFYKVAREINKVAASVS